MSSSRFLHSWIIMLALSLATLARGQMILTSEVDGVSRAIAEVREGRIWLENGASPSPVPEGVTWRLTGDLAKAADILRVAPFHRLTRLAGAELAADASRPFRCMVSVPYPEGRASTTPLHEIWPMVKDRESIVVIAWVVDRQATQVAVRAISAAMLGNGRLIESVFRLSSAESRGQPVMLLWQAGKFVPPVSRFRQDPARIALLSASLNDAAELKSLLDKRPSLVKAVAGGSLLHYAAQAGSIDAVNVLLDSRADLNSRSSAFEDTPLHWASRNGRIEVVRALIAAGAEINTLTAVQETPVLLAAEAGHREVVELLLGAGGRFTFMRKPDPRGATDAMVIGYGPGLINSYVNTYDQTERVMINLALRGRGDIAALFLSQEVHLNREFEGMTALHAAAFAGDHELVASILAKEISSDLPNRDGLTPMMWAAMGGSHRVVDTLLAAGADPARAAKNGRTALHYAALADALEVTNALVAVQADVEPRDATGATPLELALMSDARDVAIRLASLGAEVDLRGPRNREVIDSVLRLDVAPALRAMLSAGLSPQLELASGWPLLRVAQHYGSSSCNELLFQSGTPESRLTDSEEAGGTQNRSRPEVTAVVVPADPRNLGADYPSGQVSVALVVGADGRVHFPKITATPDRQLGTVTRQAVAKWTFKPAVKDGSAVEVRLALPISFASAAERREQAYVDEIDPLAIDVPGVGAVLPRFP